MLLCAVLIQVIKQTADLCSNGVTLNKPAAAAQAGQLHLLQVWVLLISQSRPAAAAASKRRITNGTFLCWITPAEVSPNTVFTRTHSSPIQSQPAQDSQKKNSITNVVIISSVHVKFSHYLRFLHRFLQLGGESRVHFVFSNTKCGVVIGLLFVPEFGTGPTWSSWRSAGTLGRAGPASLSCVWEQETERWDGRASILGLSCSSCCILILNDTFKDSLRHFCNILFMMVAVDQTTLQDLEL